VDNNIRVTSVSVRPVEGRGDFARFINHPYHRHANDAHWVPPLRWGERERLTARHNPFFDHADVALFLAWRGDRVAGRIAAIDDRLHLETHCDNTAMFGFFEADDATTAASLLETAEAWARARGRGCLRGPINPSLNDHAGLLIDGFDTDPMILMPHNPREYAAFIEAAGYQKAKDLYAWIYDVAREPVAMARAARHLKNRRGVTIRPFNVREFQRESARLRELYNAAWERNWGFTPPTPREFARLAKEMKPILDPRIALCAEIDGRMIACVVAIPDVNQALKGTGGTLFPTGLIRLLRRRRYIDQARVLLVGIDPQFRRSFGIFPLLMVEVHQHAKAAGYKRLEFSWTLEDNSDVNGPAEAVGSVRYRTYRIYQKGLAP